MLILGQSSAVGGSHRSLESTLPPNRIVRAFTYALVSRNSTFTSPDFQTPELKYAVESISILPDTKRGRQNRKLEVFRGVQTSRLKIRVRGGSGSVSESRKRRHKNIRTRTLRVTNGIGKQGRRAARQRYE